MKIIKYTTAFLLAISLFSACKKDESPIPEATKPTVELIEIGYNNNKMGVQGKDFHLNADIIAGDKIESVQVKILQKNTETYAQPWTFELTWSQYKGAKNTNVHKHFDIPKDAPEGKYDFIFLVIDQNGSTLEIKEDFRIYHPDKLPVDPAIKVTVTRNMNLMFKGEKLKEGGLINKGDSLFVNAEITNIKDDGVAYVLLIKQNANYRPETAAKLDFSKAIVIFNREHSFLKVSGFSTYIWNKDPNISSYPVNIKIGAANDNNSPVANAINGGKSWESGNYNIVIVYTNTTHNMSAFKSFPITINY
ncbi:MAG: DUF4625 domain-containing protein [Pedobacter sp.]